jgi:ribonuclease E
LGTTSKRVLDALRELDGRIRSAHSSVDRVDAVRVRDLLSAAPTDSAEPGEPESRLILETTTVERAEYLPLFVAPQPIQQAPDRSDSDDSDEADEADEAEDSEDFDDSDGDGDDDQAERPANRRRRRGRRGRGRGRGEQADNQDEGGSEAGGGSGKAGDAEAGDAANDSDDDDSDDAESGEDDSGSSETGNRRRRRRRRRKAGSGDSDENSPSSPSPDDPPNTVVHERPPRSADKSDGQNGDSANTEIQGIDGSTRLEAKRQRRRDGRDAGRRRAPVLSEADASGLPLHPDRGARGRHRRRALRHQRGLRLPGWQHLPGDRAERAAFDGGGVRRHRAWPQRRAVRG